MHRGLERHHAYPTPLQPPFLPERPFLPVGALKGGTVESRHAESSLETLIAL